MKMKKVWQIISVVLVIVLSLGMTAFAENEKTTIVRIDGATVNAGDEFELMVCFENCEEVSSLRLGEFNFGEGISIVEVEALADGVAISDWNGERFVAAFAENTNCNGNFLKLSLKVAEDAYTNETEIKLDAVIRKMNGDDEVDVPCEIVAGKIVINGVEPPKKQEELVAERKQDVIALKINAGTAYAFGKTEAIDPDNSKVVPYLKNDRTLVPLRFVSETLGAEVKWEKGWNYCYVVKGDKEIKITFNSADIEVNGKVVTYDAPVEVVQDRTMVPIRFISEELGYDVKWNKANRLVIITPADNPWVEDRQAEKDVLEGILVTYLFNGIF